MDRADRADLPRLGTRQGLPPTADDLSYHMSTLFPPVRPRGHLELRMIDAQPGDGWIVPTAVVSALVDDPGPAQAAMAAVEPLWRAHGRPPGAGQGGGPRATVAPHPWAAWRCPAAIPIAACRAARSPWATARRTCGCGPPGWAWPTHQLALAAQECFAAALAALSRLGAPAHVQQAVATFADRYVLRGRCPADDRLDEARAGTSPISPAIPDPCGEDES